jgi:hypothetical protein
MKSYAIPDDTITDLVNAMILLRTMRDHYPRLDQMGQINLDVAADAIQALTDLAQAQHPVDDVVLEVAVR